MSAEDGTRDPGAGPRGPIEGRDRELAAVARLVRAATGGRGGSLVLRGPHGSGRSTLLSAGLAPGSAAGLAGVRIVRLAGVATETDWPGAAANRLIAELDCAATTLSEPEHHALALHHALTATGEPLVCLVDDAELLDRPSLEQLASAGRRLADQPVALVIATTVTGAAADPLAGLDELRLAPLTEHQGRVLAARLLAARLGVAPTGIPADLVTAIEALGHGNPLAITELTELVHADQLDGTGPAPSGLPASGRLRAHHRARLHALGTDVQLVLLLAAIQQPIEVPTLIRAARQAGLAVSAIDAAAATGLITIDDETVRMPDRLLAASVAAEAPLARRLAAHRVLADVMDHDAHRLDRAWHEAMALPGLSREALVRQAADLEAVSQAAAAGGDQVGAARGLERAAALTTEPGVAAVRLAAAGRAAWLAGNVRQARSLLTRARLLARDPRLRSSVDLLLGEIELRSGTTRAAYEALTVVADGLSGPQRDQAVTALLRASEVLMVAGDHGRFLSMAAKLRRPVLEAESPRTTLLFDQLAGFAASFRGAHAEADAPLRSVIELAPRTHDPSALILATAAAMTVADEVAGESLAEQAVVQARSSEDRAQLPVALEFLAFMQFLRGQYDAGAETAHAGLAAAHRAGQDNSVAAHLAILALLATIPGDREEPLQHARIAARKADGRGLCRPRALTIWASARMALARARPEDAEPALRAAFCGPATHAVPHGMHLTIRVMATPDLVEAAVLHGDPARASAALDTYRSWASQVRTPSVLALLARCDALTGTDDDAVERDFERALELHDEDGPAFERARTELLYGRALRRRRRPARARAHLEAAFSAFELLGAQLWATQARGELRAAGGGVTTQDVSDLTPQQSEIARLVAGGATNREIAAQLFLSPRTVDHHLRNIFVRLGVRSRTELARLVS